MSRVCPMVCVSARLSPLLCVFHLLRFVCVCVFHLLRFVCVPPSKICVFRSLRFVLCPSGVRPRLAARGAQAGEEEQGVRSSLAQPGGATP